MPATPQWSAPFCIGLASEAATSARGRMHVAYLRLYGGKFEWLGDRLCWSQICVCAPSVGRNSRRRVPSAEVKENVTLYWFATPCVGVIATPAPAERRTGHTSPSSHGLYHDHSYAMSRVRSIGTDSTARHRCLAGSARPAPSAASVAATARPPPARARRARPAAPRPPRRQNSRGSASSS